MTTTIQEALNLAVGTIIRLANSPARLASVGGTLDVLRQHMTPETDPDTAAEIAEASAGWTGWPEHMTPAEITVRSAAHEQNLRDILTTAIEGGINYWAAVRHIKRMTQDPVSFEVRDAEDPKAEWKHVTLDSLDAAIAKIIDGNMSEAQQFVGYKYDDWNGCDAIAADVAVQVAASNRVIFG